MKDQALVELYFPLLCEVFLHTQPSSFRAIKLHSDFGFAFLTDPIIGYRKNDLEECLTILKEHMPQKDFEKLQFI